MKMIVIAFALIAAATAAPQLAPSPLRTLPALQHEEIHDDFGQYALRYVTAEGTIVEERGRLIPNPDGPGHVLVTDGEVSYLGEDGKRYITKYSAGLDGFKAEGEHFPSAPEPLPVPEVVLPVAPAVPVVQAPIPAIPAPILYPGQPIAGAPVILGSAHVLVTDGEVSYLGEDGKRYITKYSAGLDGFKAEGEYFPSAPEPLPVPEVVFPVAPAVPVVRAPIPAIPTPILYPGQPIPGAPVILG